MKTDRQSDLHLTREVRERSAFTALFEAVAEARASRYQRRQLDAVRLAPLLTERQADQLLADQLRAENLRRAGATSDNRSMVALGWDTAGRLSQSFVVVPR
jgi:hypothetical protein